MQFGCFDLTFHLRFMRKSSSAGREGKTEQRNLKQKQREQKQMRAKTDKSVVVNVTLFDMH